MKGCYILIIELKDNITIQIGKIGNLIFKKGFYAYIGSALNGLEQRIDRHLRKEKKIRWHIDYLLQHGRIIKIFYKENNKKEECNIAKKFEEELLSISNFGCGDCKCNSHLFHGNLKEILHVVDPVNIKQYNLNAKI
jgi:Uri superfamily endonuclease